MWKRNLTQVNSINRLLWLVLSFQAGFINAGGFLACHRFVTHTTGFATQFGAEFALGHWMNAAGMLSVPLFFLTGAILSAALTDARVARGREPLYTLLTGIIGTLMMIVTAAGQSGVFGDFGAPLDIRMDYILIALLCLASGIQNAAFTSASGAVIRTTHLTGITTDLGIGIVRLLTKGVADQSRQLEWNAVQIRLILILGFVMGSTVGAFSFLNLQYRGFLFPAFISLGLFFVGVRKMKRLRYGP